MDRNQKSALSMILAQRTFVYTARQAASGNEKALKVMKTFDEFEKFLFSKGDWLEFDYKVIKEYADELFNQEPEKDE